MSSKFDDLKQKLEQENWPQVYFFKFICPSDSKKIAKVTGLFENDNNIVIRASRNGNYTSISVKEVMSSATEVITIYEAAAKIEKVIVL